MKGTNTFELNQTTMIEVVQHYCDTILFKQGQSQLVTGVCKATQGGGFAVTVKSKDVEQDQ